MISDIIESRFSLASQSTGSQVREAFREYSDLLCVALVDDGKPVGLISRSDFLLRYTDELAHALYDRRPAMLLANRAPPIFEADRAVADLVAVSESSDTAQLLKGFIVTREGRYVGVSSLLTMFKVTRARAESLQTLFSDLEYAHQRAVEADAAKTRFLATMSHELRTPLNAILGYAELIADEYGELSAGLLHDVDRIGAAGRHLLGLIDEVLDFSRLEAGAVRVSPEWFDVAAWAQDVVNMIRPLAARNGNRLVFEIAPGLQPVFADSARLRQCLFNLGGNACKFTSDGLVAVSISAQDEWLSLKVSDTGIGMSDEQIARLFRPFSQADDSISRRFGGTGLGLSITHKLIHLLGGELHVESKLGMGSTFELRLPLSVPESSEVPGAAAA